MDPSQKHTRRDMTQRRKGSVTPTYYPTAEEIEIPDLLRWVAKNSAFEAGSPPSKQGEEELLVFESQYVPPKTGSDVVTLSPSPTILRMGEKQACEAIEREKNEGMVIGRIPATTVCKVHTKQYQLSGSDCRFPTDTLSKWTRQLENPWPLSLALTPASLIRCLKRRMRLRR